MTLKDTSLTVQPPIPQKHLGRHRDKKGVYLVRQNETVLYVGASENIYKTVMRLFQKGGILSHLNRNRLQFEVLKTSLRFRTIENVLKRYFEPEYNKRIKRLTQLTKHEKSQQNRVLDAYLSQSRFEVQGEQKTDSKTKQ
jgi:excinuclease UvrABC nuclease subunit